MIYQKIELVYINESKNRLSLPYEKKTTYLFFIPIFTSLSKL